MSNWSSQINQSLCVTRRSWQKFAFTRNSQTPTRRAFLMKSQVSCQSSKRSCQEVSWQGGIGIRHHSDCSIGQILACTHLYLNMYLRYQNLGLNCNQESEMEINSSKIFRFFRCILEMKKNSPMNSMDFVFMETCMRYHEIWESGPDS